MLWPVGLLDEQDLDSLRVTLADLDAFVVTDVDALLVIDLDAFLVADMDLTRLGRLTGDANAAADGLANGVVE